MDKFLIEILMKWNDGLAVYIDPQSIDENSNPKWFVARRWMHEAAALRTNPTDDVIGFNTQINDCIVNGLVNTPLIRSRAIAALDTAAK